MQQMRYWKELLGKLVEVEGSERSLMLHKRSKRCLKAKLKISAIRMEPLAYFQVMMAHLCSQLNLLLVSKVQM